MPCTHQAATALQFALLRAGNGPHCACTEDHQAPSFLPYVISKDSLAILDVHESTVHIPIVRVPRVGRRPDGPLVSQSSPGNGTFSFFLVMVRIMDLFPLFRSRQHPVVERKPVIREGFQEFQLGARPFQIMAKGGRKLAPHICVEHDRFGEGTSERCWVDGRHLPANLGNRGVAGTQMIEHIVKPHLCVIVEQAGDAPKKYFDGPRTTVPKTSA